MRRSFLLLALLALTATSLAQTPQPQPEARIPVPSLPGMIGYAGQSVDSQMILKDVEFNYDNWLTITADGAVLNKEASKGDAQVIELTGRVRLTVTRKK